MQLIHVAAGSLNQTPLDWHRNRANIFAAIESDLFDGEHGAFQLIAQPRLLDRQADQAAVPADFHLDQIVAAMFVQRFQKISPVW